MLGGGRCGFFKAERKVRINASRLQIVRLFHWDRTHPYSASAVIRDGSQCLKSHVSRPAQELRYIGFAHSHFVSEFFPAHLSVIQHFTKRLSCLQGEPFSHRLCSTKKMPEFLHHVIFFHNSPCR